MMSCKSSNPCRQRRLRTRDDFTNDSSVERKRSALIAFSCISLVVAGLFSRASFAESDSAPAQKIIRVGAKFEAASRDARFARNEIARFRKLARELQQRASEEAQGASKVKMEAAIKSLQDRLLETGDAVEEFETSTGRRDFQYENLKGSLFALQEAGQAAVSTFVDVDNAHPEDAARIARYVLKESRTGQ